MQFRQIYIYFIMLYVLEHIACSSITSTTPGVNDYMYHSTPTVHPYTKVCVCVCMYTHPKHTYLCVVCCVLIAHTRGRSTRYGTVFARVTRKQRNFALAFIQKRNCPSFQTLSLPHPNVPCKLVCHRGMGNPLRHP